MPARARPRILLVEDDERLGRQVVERLEEAGFALTWLRDGESARGHDFTVYVLVVLDLMLPGVDGLDVLKRVRVDSDVPVLILSARHDASDKVRSLQLGADDYLTKPFWPEELVARVRARLRRPVLMHGSRLDVGPLALDVEARTASVEGQDVPLTKVEFDLLAALARRPGEAVSRAWLTEHVLDPERDGTERTLDVHVSRLRKKLGAAGSCLATVWGVGYRLEVASAP